MIALRHQRVNTRLRLVAKVIFLMFLLPLLSCSKVKKTDGSPVTSYLSFLNAIPKNSSSVDLFIENVRANSLIIPFSQGLDYTSITEGMKRLDITFGTPTSVANETVNIETGKYYTAFAIGKGPYEIYLTTDDRASLPPAGKAKLRFINLSPDAPNIDFGILGGANLFTNQAYKSASDFVTIDPSNLNLVVRQAGSGTTKASKIDAFFDNGGIYTVVAIGSWTNSSDPMVEIRIIKNK